MPSGSMNVLTNDSQSRMTAGAVVSRWHSACIWFLKGKADDQLSVVSLDLS